MKPKNGDLFVYPDFSGILLYQNREWWQWTNNTQPFNISATVVNHNALHFIGNTGELLKVLKNASP